MSTSSLIFAAVVVFWVVGAYNRLMRHKNAIAQAFGPIDAQLKCRYDLTLNIVEALKKYLPQDCDTLEAVLSARNVARTASDALRSRPTHAPVVGAFSAAELAFEGALNDLFAAAEASPELKADGALQEFKQQLSSVGAKVSFAGQVYNTAVLDYNNAQGQFPALLIAKIFGFKPSVQLASTEAIIERRTEHLPV